MKLLSDSDVDVILWFVATTILKMDSRQEFWHDEVRNMTVFHSIHSKAIIQWVIGLISTTLFLSCGRRVLVVDLLIYIILQSRIAMFLKRCKLILCPSSNQSHPRVPCLNSLCIESKIDFPRRSFCKARKIEYLQCFSG